MAAYGYMFLSVLMFSLFPLAMALGSLYGAIWFLLLALTVSAILSLVCYALFIMRRPQVHGAFKAYLKQASLEDYLFMAFASLCAVLNYVFLVFAMNLMSSAGAAVIYETWPIFSMFLAPLIIRKAWSKARPIQYVLAGAALIGILVISLGEQNMSLAEMFHPAEIAKTMNEVDLYRMLGSVLAFFGGVMLALFVNMRTEISNRMKQFHNDLSNDIDTTVAGELIVRCGSIPFVLMALAFMPLEDRVMNEAVIAPAIGVALILYFGNMAFTMALLKTSSAAIHIMYYIVPALAVFWLALFGLAEINDTITAGIMIIIAANLLAALPGRKRVQPKLVELDTK